MIELGLGLPVHSNTSFLKLRWFRFSAVAKTGTGGWLGIAVVRVGLDSSSCRQSARPLTGPRLGWPRPSKPGVYQTAHLIVWNTAILYPRSLYPLFCGTCFTSVLALGSVSFWGNR